MNEYLSKHNLITNSQYGFRKNVSTIDAILYATESFRLNIDKNEFTACALLDLSKTFDSLNHEILKTKLTKLGFDKTAIHLLETFYKDRQQVTIVNGVQSDWINLYQGVPQGTVLGPLLFLIYVNDMIDYLPKDTQIVQYADDTMVFSSNKCLKVPNGKVENAVNILFKYFECNRLKLNCDKTELIIFCKKIKSS